MATVTLNTPIATLNYFDYFILLDEGSINQETATLISLDGPEGQILRITGSGFEYEAGLPISGTATGFTESVGATTNVSITGMSVTAAQFETFLTLDGLDVLGLLEFALRGTDTLTGSTGSDGLYGFNGNDTVNGGAGVDGLYGGNGNDTLNGGADGDVLWGGAGSDILKGNAGIDFLNGEAGLDTLDGGPGADTMSGGAHSDTYLVDNAEDSVSESSGGGTDYVRSTVSHTLATWVEHLTLLGALNLDGTGNSQANTITGNTGNNTLNGGSENDTLIGLAGNDIYVVDSSTDVVTEAANAGIDTVQSGASTFTLPVNVERLALTGEAVEGRGNTLNNLLTATENVNSTLYGESGNDTINGLNGNDILHGGLGNDTITGGSGNDELWGDAGTDSMTGGPGDDKYWLSAGEVVTESAEGGNDTLYGALSFNLANYANFEDIVLLGTTNLNATGNASDNRIIGNSGNNNINGGGSFDELKGAAGNDTINGADGGDSIEGGPGNDILIGGNGGDSIFGGTGNDTIYGRSGFDTMEGGAGNDRFVFDNAPILNDFDSNNSVIDFDTGLDKLVLDQTAFTVLSVGSLSEAALYAANGANAAQDADDRIIFDTGTGNLYYDADGTGTEFAAIQFGNMSGAELVASDILVVT